MSAEKPTLKEQRAYLVSKVIDEKQFEFDAINYGFENAGLLRAKILNLRGTTLQLTNPRLIAGESYRYLSKLYGFKLSNDERNLIAFLKQTEQHFDGKFMLGVHEFQQAVLQYAIVEFSIKHQGDVAAFVKNFSRADHEIFDFTQSLGEIFPELGLEITEIISLVSWLTEEIKVNEPGVVDLNLPAVGMGLRKLCTADIRRGMELYRECVLAPQPVLQQFHAAIIAGLLDADPTFFEEIEKLIELPNMQATAVCALGCSTFNAGTPLWDYIRTVENVNPPIQPYSLELPRFYGAVIENKVIDDPSLVQHCFDRLKHLVCQPDRGVAGQVLWQFRFLKGRDAEMASVYTALIDSENFEAGYCKVILELFHAHPAYDHLFVILRQMISKLKPAFPMDALRHTVILLRNKNKPAFDAGLIELLIDDDGYTRLIGSRILSQINIGNYVSWFSLDVLSLSALKQYKLCVAVAEDFHEPKEMLPFIVPLLDSKFDLVRELTEHKINILIENFGKPALAALRQNLDTSRANHADYLTKAEAYLWELNALTDKKRKIREFDPALNNYKHFRQYFQSREKYMRLKMNLEPEENSFLSYVSTVNLMKGGGFKVGPENAVSKLTTVETSMHLPREYALAPEKFDWERQMAFNENWKGKFEEWEVTISS